MDRGIVAVVEDDGAVRDAITLVLETEGWTVRGYTSGEQLLAAFGSGPPPRVVLLDLILPGISGAQVASKLLARDIAVVGLTAHPNSDATRQVRALGVDTILIKPVAAGVLIESLRRA